MAGLAFVEARQIEHKLKSIVLVSSCVCARRDAEDLIIAGAGVGVGFAY